MKKKNILGLDTSKTSTDETEKKVPVVDKKKVKADIIFDDNDEKTGINENSTKKDHKKKKSNKSQLKNKLLSIKDTKNKVQNGSTKESNEVLEDEHKTQLPNGKAENSLQNMMAHVNTPLSFPQGNNMTSSPLQSPIPQEITSPFAAQTAQPLQHNTPLTDDALFNFETKTEDKLNEI